MQLAFALVHIITDTLTSVLFWAYHFSERMILYAYDVCAYDLSVRRIFSARMICVRMIFLCV